MKIIFLDVDGVLNSDRWTEILIAETIETQKFDLKAMARLNRIIEATGLLSSSLPRGGNASPYPPS